VYWVYNKAVISHDGHCNKKQSGIPLSLKGSHFKQIKFLSTDLSTWFSCYCSGLQLMTISRICTIMLAAYDTG
jgi:hypothetical protein